METRLAGVRNAYGALAGHVRKLMWTNAKTCKTFVENFENTPGEHLKHLRATCAERVGACEKRVGGM